jgi:hypothetical protein
MVGATAIKLLSQVGQPRSTEINARGPIPIATNIAKEFLPHLICRAAASLPHRELRAAGPTLVSKRSLTISRSDQFSGPRPSRHHLQTGNPTTAHAPLNRLHIDWYAHRALLGSD